MFSAEQLYERDVSIYWLEGTSPGYCPVELACFEKAVPGPVEDKMIMPLF